MYSLVDPYSFASSDYSSVAMMFSLITGFFSSIVGIAAYVLVGLAVLNFCKKLNINNGWMGFVPFANVYIIGKIAEACCARQGENKKYARRLLILEIITVAAIIPLYIFAFILGYSVGASSYYGEPSPLLIFSILAFIFTALAVSALAIVSAVFLYIAYHKIYKSFVPENATLFTVISILFGIQFIFLFIASLKNPPAPAEPYYYAAPENTQQPPIYPQV